MTTCCEITRKRSPKRRSAKIVERYSDLVYSSALRQLGSPDLACDISQRVFAELGRKAGSLAPKLNAKGSVVGWLYCATRYAALAHMRDERRRRAREREAMESFNPVSETSTEWERIGPMLDDAMASLSSADREALLLRFFRNLDFRSVGDEWTGGDWVVTQRAPVNAKWDSRVAIGAKSYMGTVGPGRWDPPLIPYR